MLRSVDSGKQKFRPIDEVNYRALRLIVERAQGGVLAKRREVEKIDAAYRRGELVLPDSENEQQRWWRCEARFMLGEYSDWGGWQYRDRWAAGVWYQNPFKCPVWRGGNREERLYIVGEQGIGDEILFSGLIPEVCRDVQADRCEESPGSVVIECQQKLCEPLRRSFRRRGLNVETRAAKLIPDEKRGEGFIRIAQEPAEVGATAWVTMGELCRVYRRRLEDFPRTAYLEPQAAGLIEPHGRVCVSWRGAQGSIDLDSLKTLYPDALSVQYDQGWDEEIDRPAHIDLKDDIDALIGVLLGCERLVTVSTSVAHLAAALGVKTDVVLADPGTGRRGGLFPWKWWCERKSQDGVTCKSAWYGDHVTVYKNWRVYESEIRRQRKHDRKSGEKVAA